MDHGPGHGARALCALRLALPALIAFSLSGALLAQPRSFPDTTDRIRVFNDQLATWSMSDAQFRFAATHYAGCQKVTREAARRLRSHSPGFLVLHYRLGQALGLRGSDESCRPTGEPIRIIVGNDWVDEWPGDRAVQESWFFHYRGSRVYNCPDAHFIMELNDAGWRGYWSAQVLAQMRANENDGLFADSYSIPNYFGPENFRPHLPDVDASFEAQWARRQHAFTDYIQGRFQGRYKWIPNLGALINSRDPSDYSNVDGAMVENFAEWGDGNYFDPADWELQMNRTLALTRAGKIVIAQSYPNAGNVSERLFVLGSFLLVKGARTYVNLETNEEPEWYPEYGVNLGAPVDPLPASVTSFLNRSWGLYVRRYQGGMVLVNPSDAARTADLGGMYGLAVPSGGGIVPESGNAPGTLSFRAVSSVTVPAHGAAILLTRGGPAAGSQGGPCTLSCSASAPSSGQTGQALSFSATAQARGCTAAPVFTWDLGDGSRPSGPSGKHAYKAAGVYTWTLTVTAGGQTCARRGQVTITRTQGKR